MVAELEQFILAFDAAAVGDIDRSLVPLGNVNSLALQDWFHIHAQNVGPWRAGRFTPNRSRRATPRDDIAKHMPRLFARDGYRCRYCEQRVIPRRVLTRFATCVGREAFPTSGGNHGRHGVILCFSATLDHVTPVAAGGETSEDNLVTACWPCNYGKAEFTLEELGIEDPRRRPPVIDSWRGLTDRAWKEAS